MLPVGRVKAICRPGPRTTLIQQSPNISRRRALVCVSAKKGSGSKKGVSALQGLMDKKKKAEEEATAGPATGPSGLASPLQFADPEIRGLLFSLASSYFKATKTYLLDEVELEQLADAFFHANFACLISDRFQEGVTDPKYIYANKAALELWETNWEKIVQMPSRLSAVEDPETQQYRDFVMDLPNKSPLGVATGQEGWRVSHNGKQFKMLGVTILNIQDFSGDLIGQAEIFNQYELVNGTVVEVQSAPWQPREVEMPPSEEDLIAAEAAVEEQGAYVRSLKEGKGLANQDPEVKNAVAELKHRKDQLEELRRKVEVALAAADAAFDD